MKSGITVIKFLLVVFIWLGSKTLLANGENGLLNATTKLDFRTMHIWRGSATSYVPTFEPSFEITRNNSTTGIWFAQSVDGSYTELDLYFTYDFKSFSFTVYDYYCPTSIETSNEITNFKRETTKHTIELDATFNGTTRFPVKVLVATMIYGDDINAETNKHNYSTYVELGYGAQIDQNTLDLFVGFNMFQSYYGDQFGIVNAGLTAYRNIQVTEAWNVPVQASLITNPTTNSVFMNFGFTL